MSTYQITSFAGVDLGTYDAPGPRSALDAMATEAGYADHAASCAATGSDPADWTSSPAAFARGDYALLVAERYEGQ